MTRKDILEIKKRLKKEGCTFSRMCGCYVDANREIVLRLEENFLNLAEEEFYKYLDIAGRCLSGTLGNNLLSLEFDTEDEGAGSSHRALMGIRESALKNPELLEAFYRQIIDNYDYVGNFLILLFHDAYDVIKKTTDNDSLDESEEVYTYILCAICPVELSKPGLGYKEAQNRFGTLERDWVVSPPENGFLFPAFTDRSTDIHSLLYYTKTPRTPHPELMDAVLGCREQHTSTEHKKTFEHAVSGTAGADEKTGEDYYIEVQASLNDMLSMREASDADEDREPLRLTEDVFRELGDHIELPEEVVEKIMDSCREAFEDEAPIAEQLIDKKAVSQAERRREVRNLVQKVDRLTDELKAEREKHEPEDANAVCDVILKVSRDKAESIETRSLEGRRYLLIPLEENEMASINGEIL